MGRSSFLWLRRVLTAAAILLPILACATEDGERATMGCPDDETCSDATPEGLQFSAVAPSDWLGPLPGVALGGRQEIRFSPLGGYTLPEFSVDPGGTLEVNEAVRIGSGGRLDVVGVAEGTDYLRILAQDESGLLDRVQVTVAEADRVFVRPFAGNVELMDAFDEGWALAPGVDRFAVLVVLEDATGLRLVDLDVGLAADAADAGGAPEDAWDVLSLDRGGASEVVVRYAGTTQTLRDAGPLDGFTAFDADLGELAIDWTCAVPTSGGVPVFGAPMTYQWDDMDAPEPYGELLAEYPWAEAPCFPLPGGEGVRTVTVRSGTVEADIEVDLAAEREAAVHFGAPGVQLGERAGG
ncbi:MAG TPA: hypothetical protein RMH85_31670 [Polyangiaceae bacterium LLY-WYZ-15_(1-7)]|nr:hypothetical protein [Sandaracinus sp.]HJK93178.1 hypothetical protein [Polyangiaceae bacterium LLY-WYZ-15_(1-7)]HJL00749.1 hypothetical protein [Polyangiaceae bacterium LLY-WYZ-15_(1-7)]HJL13084.1 hypothetical protein [Polyangiaceae bacterium LLY-WYZ-15_(1-7)]HJL23107.1 hypothetical protein [Polyangiaceae bacterium LLY-WYZ-15_(1-7)]